MDIPRKVEIVGQAIKSISQHADESVEARGAALDAVVDMVEAERQAMMDADAKKAD